MKVSLITYFITDELSEYIITSMFPKPYTPFYFYMNQEDDVYRTLRRVFYDEYNTDIETYLVNFNHITTINIFDNISYSIYKVHVDRKKFREFVNRLKEFNICVIKSQTNNHKVKKSFDLFVPVYNQQHFELLAV